MLCIPLTATPVGWAILGLGGYALYRAGKKRGEEEAAAGEISAVPAKLEATEAVSETKKTESKGGK